MAFPVASTLFIKRVHSRRLDQSEDICDVGAAIAEANGQREVVPEAVPAPEERDYVEGDWPRRAHVRHRALGRVSALPGRGVCVLTCLPARGGRFQCSRIPIRVGRASPA